MSGRPGLAATGPGRLGLATIGIKLSGGHAVEPEQSTLALIVHHPQAGYFGMRNGRLLPEGSADDVIKGTDRDLSLFGVTAERSISANSNGAG